MRQQLSQAVETWKSDIARANTPDAERAWLDVRRAIRIDRDASRRSKRGVLPWALPAGIAAGLAVYGLTFLQPGTGDTEWQSAFEEGAGVEYVDVPADAASMVFVDDESGWVVVWTTPSTELSGAAPDNER